MSPLPAAPGAARACPPCWAYTRKDANLKGRGGRRAPCSRPEEALEALVAEELDQAGDPAGVAPSIVLLLGCYFSLIPDAHAFCFRRSQPHRDRHLQDFLPRVGRLVGIHDDLRPLALI